MPEKHQIDASISKLPSLPAKKEEELIELQEVLKDEKQQEILISCLTKLGEMKPTSIIYYILN